MANKYFIIYKTINLINNRIYIGKHVSNIIIDSYIGSGKILLQSIEKYGIENFKRENLFIFDNEEDMNLKEEELVDEEFIKRKDTYNIKLGGVGGWDHMIGKVVVQDSDNKILCVPKDDHRYLSKELLPLTCGLVVVKAENGETYRVPIDDPRYLSGELVPIGKGLVTVEDKYGNTFKTSIDDPRYLSGELVPIGKGLVTVEDKYGNTFKTSIDDPRYLSGELIPYIRNKFKDHIVVKDKNGKCTRIKNDDPRYLSGELVSIHKDLITVKDKKGKCFKVNKNDSRYLSGELVGVNKNRKHSEETKNKISKASLKRKGKKNPMFGRIWIYNDKERKSVPVYKGEIEKWYEKGWKKGKRNY